MEYDIEPPEHCVIKAWSNKLLETGSLFDKPRSGLTNLSPNLLTNLSPNPSLCVLRGL